MIPPDFKYLPQLEITKYINIEKYDNKKNIPISKITYIIYNFTADLPDALSNTSTTTEKRIFLQNLINIKFKFKIIKMPSIQAIINNKNNKRVIINIECDLSKNGNFESNSKILITCPSIIDLEGGFEQLNGLYILESTIINLIFTFFYQVIISYIIFIVIYKFFFTLK